MKIVGVETFVVGNPLPRRGGRYFVFVRLTTDSGITGLGEVYVATFSPHVLATMIVDVAERHVVGADPRHIEQMWRAMYGRGFQLRADPTLVGVMSGLEMACWDIVGKEVGQPVYELLGGRVHERLRTYTYIYPPGNDDAHSDHPVYSDPNAAAERAVEYVARGFTALKFDPAGPYTVHGGRQPTLDDLERSEAFMRLLREAVGPRVDLLFGTHGQFTPSGAIRMARRLEPYDPLWLEEPTPPDDYEGMATVARQTTIPIASGERLATKYEFRRLLETGAASILQPDLGRCGGLLEGKKIAALAEAFNAQIAPHLYCGPVVGAANIQLATCSPNFLIAESIEEWDGFYAELLRAPITWEDGYVIPPSAPGLGIELNDEVARANPYTGTELHLEMRETPYG
jgi:galactonate dehydratase